MHSMEEISVSFKFIPQGNFLMQLATNNLKLKAT